MDRKQIDDPGNPTGETPDERQAYKNGIKAGAIHQVPSQKTLEKFTQMTEELTNIKIDMAEQKSDIKYIKEKLDDHISKESELPEKMDELKTLIMGMHETMNTCYYRREDIDKAIDSRAAKWVETLLKKIGYIIGVGIIGGLGTLLWRVLEVVFKK